jgi:hypothetical protein
VEEVWEEVCYRTEVHASPGLLPSKEARRFLSHMAQLHLDFQIKCSSMKLLNEMKMKTQSVVESLYEFNTSQDPQIISRNASRAQALLAETTFIYQVYLILSHLEHCYMGYRSSILAGAHVIHIDIQ